MAVDLWQPGNLGPKSNPDHADRRLQRRSGASV